MNDTNLFAHVRTRTTDPATSRRAAAQVSGKAGAHRELILKAVRARPGMTPREIAAVTGLDYHAVQRRLCEIPQIEPRGEREGCRCWWVREGGAA